MKKKLTWIISLIMAVTVIAPTGSAFAMTDSDLSYSSTETTATISWANPPADVDHFEIIMDGQVLSDNVKASKTSYKISKLDPKSSHSVTINAIGITTDEETGTETATVLETAKKTVKTKAFAALKATTIKKVEPVQGLKKATVTYKGKLGAKGYQVQVYKDGAWKNVTKSTTKKKVTLKDLKKFKTYKVRVRYYKNKKANGKTYKVWSKWATKTFVETGQLDKWRLYDEKGKLVAVDQKMLNIINDKNYYSRTPYLVICNRDKCRVVVYKNTGKKVNGKYQSGKGKWQIYKYWKCATGRSEHKTPRVNRLSTGKKMISFNGKNREGKTYTCWYATNIVGAVHFHSELYYAGNHSRIMTSQLGQRASHGCVRLKQANARWLYNNINKGTRIIVYEN